MTTKFIKSYLTDITTSEGNLSRHSLICEIIGRTKFHDSATLFRKIAEEAGITNSKVIGRHLHILETIGLIIKAPETYLATSRGKALVKLRSRNIGVLNNAEKTVFFKSFFTNIPEQLYWAIYVIGKNEKATLEKNAIEYFYYSPAKNIWIKTIERAIRREQYKARPLTRGMINKFETMLYWLSQLDNIRRGYRVWLTDNGLKMLDAFPTDGNFREFSSRIYHITAQLYGNQNIQYFDLTRHKSDLVKVLREGNQLFRGEHGLSDLVAIQEFTSTVLATSGIVLEEKKFYETIQELGLDGTIKSIILGRDGKPAFLIMD